MVVFPNCKINLGLDILCRRSDGFHEIRTAMAGVDWTDVLEIVPAVGDSDTLTVTGRGVNCPPEKNLVMRAIRAVRALRDFGSVDVYLEKIIPDGAGLGGGSSDAAFAVMAVNDLFDLGMNRAEMADIASTVGSDCPFFIYNTPMLASGRGEILEPMAGLDAKLSGYKVVIIKPEGCSVSTAAAYAGVTPRVPDVDIVDVLDLPIVDWRHELKNDFETSIFAIHPHLADIKANLYEAGAIYAAMSGSGSSIFGIFDSEIDLADISKCPNAKVANLKVGADIA